jgi:tyrosine-protein kinase Etk/Wzc
MLQSRSVAESIVNRFRLDEVYEEPLMVDAVKALNDATKFTVTKEGVISVEVDDRDPVRAAQIANAYVQELLNLTKRLAVSEAARRRAFFEGQLRQAKEDLTGSEAELKRVQEKTGLILPEGQARATIQSVAMIQAEIASKEVQLSAMRSFATAENPDLIRVQQEIAALRRHLASLQRSQNQGQGDIQVATKDAPAAALEYARAFRDLKYHEAMYEFLAKQFEAAKIDESKDAPLVQVLDRAVPPERKSKPKRRNLILAAGAAGVFLGCLVVMILELLRRWSMDPEVSTRWMRLQSLLRPARPAQ